MRKKNLPLIILIALLSISLFNNISCRHETFLSDGLDSVCFEEQILPIILNSGEVTGCRDTGTGSAGIVI